MKIISINKFFWMKGGSEAVFFGEKNLLESHGHDVIPFSMQDDKNDSSPYNNYFISNVDYADAGSFGKIKAAMNILYSFEARSKMEELLKNESADVAHFHIFQHQISPSVFGPLRKRNIPLVLTLHDLKPMCPVYRMYANDSVCEKCKGRKFYNCFLNKCTKGSAFKSLINTVEMYLHYMLGYYQKVNKYIAVSRFYRNKMIEYGFSPDQVAYIPNFIDADKFDNDYADEGYGLYFGRLSHEKGLDHLLEAIMRVPDIPFYIVGTGPSEQDLKQITTDNDLGNVNFLGYKTGDDLRKLVSEASFTVVPSIWYENCPMSVLESLAMQTPVIGADIGGIPELINEGRDGLVYAAGDSDMLAEKMTEMMSNKKLRETMGNAGREKIKSDFSKEGHYEQLISLYRSLV